MHQILLEIYELYLIFLSGRSDRIHCHIKITKFCSCFLLVVLFSCWLNKKERKKNEQVSISFFHNYGPFCLVV